MTRREKAILALVCAAEIINCAKAGALKSRIADLETQRDIYASRAQHWIDRAVEDEEVIDSMQLRLDALADGKVELEDPQQQVRSSLRWRSWYNLLFVFVIHPGGVWGWAALCGATRLECPRWNHASTPAAMLAKSSCWTLGTISGALCLWLSSSRAITNAAASRSLLIKSQR